ncbi:MAG: V-type ATP synthase subunit I [Bacteroidaceae bacterium]|nr:V-type ATP synthase subunit I [Bacteroidaceae bacterium]
MKKLTFLVYHREYEEFLQQLQELGVMHVVTSDIEPRQSETISAYTEQIRRATILQREMENLLYTNDLEAEKVDGDAEKGIEQIQELLPRFDHLKELRNKRTEQETQLKQLEPWGNFDPTLVRDRMQSAGCELQFYVAPTKVYNKQIADNYPVLAVSAVKKSTHFVLVTRGEEIAIPATRQTLPEVALNQLQADHAALLQELTTGTETLLKLSQQNLPHVEAALRMLNAKMQFNTVKENTDTAAEDHLMVLTGWFPANHQEELEKTFADTATWYEISDPTPEDDIPIHLKNNSFFGLFEVITKLYMLPKYSELDLTPFFAPFYIIFFGLCLGDSGYGLFLIIAAMLAKRFMKNIMRGAMNLLITLGISAFFAGFLTGGFFGFNIYSPESPLYAPQFEKIGNIVSLTNSQMFNLALILGCIQIIFGMILKVANKTIQLGFRYSLSTIAWLVILLAVGIGMFMPEYSPITQWVAIGGCVIAFCYNSPDAYKKPLTALPLNIGLGLWDAYNMATGLLGDLLSYIRLFALGLSGGIVASVFNDLAGAVGIVGGLFIFAFGHILNIFMNILGSGVHSMRLTFVEFFKNSGYEGGGQEYRPFRK